MRASAPASSANLGPGFDCLALALDLRCEVSVEKSDGWQVHPDDPTGSIESAARTMSADPLTITIDSDIPIGRGLGSSAAVRAALAAAVGRLAGTSVDLEALYSVVAAQEGHPDNAAAAVFGGLVLAGPETVHRLELHPSFSAVVAVPDETLPTSEARSSLPAMVPFGVAAHTSRRAIALIEGLRTGNLELLDGMGGDELHEPHRVAIRPVIGQLLDAARRAGAPAAFISGAGPSVLALVTDQTRPGVVTAFEELGTNVLIPKIAPHGVMLT